MQYYSVANLTQGLLNNTEILMNMQMQRLVANVGSNGFANSDYTEATEREEFEYYGYKG